VLLDVEIRVGRGVGEKNIAMRRERHLEFQQAAGKERKECIGRFAQMFLLL
jgi:hypothetical protein